MVADLCWNLLDDLDVLRPLAMAQSSPPSPRKAPATRHQRSRLPGGWVAIGLKLMESDQSRWRGVNALHLVPQGRAGATFLNGKLVERPDKSGGVEQAA